VAAGDNPTILLRDRLRHDIVNSVYNPRERLVEAELAERYGVTRSAMRAALIEREHNRGARIRALSVGEAVEIAQVRRQLETLVAARAAERATQEERKALRAIVREMKKAVTGADVATYLGANTRFHTAILEMARHDVAAGILTQLGNLNFNRHFPLAFVSDRPLTSLAEHERIADAIDAGDAGAAERAMHEHLTSLIELLETQAA
jgi:DNA-binding GntR family transcriptional regulator